MRVEWELITSPVRQDGVRHLSIITQICIHCRHSTNCCACKVTKPKVRHENKGKVPSAPSERAWVRVIPIFFIPKISISHLTSISNPYSPTLVLKNPKLVSSVLLHGLVSDWIGHMCIINALDVLLFAFNEYIFTFCVLIYEAITINQIQVSCKYRCSFSYICLHNKLQHDRLIRRFEWQYDGIYNCFNRILLFFKPF